MTAVDIQRIASGIAAYAYEQNVVLRLLRKKGEFSETEFDRWFRGVEYRRPIRARPLHGDAFLLGDLHGGQWAWWLHLVQTMIAIGLIETEIKEGVIVYRRTGVK